MVQMVSKSLKKMEVLRGFIRIPVENKSELIGNVHLPCFTTLNGNPARLDKYGRLWSQYLKNRFLVGTKIELSKIENGYQVAPIGSKQEHVASEIRQREDVMSVRADSESKTSAWHMVLEGDCLKNLDDGSVNNVAVTFLDPPYRQGKNYRFFDDNQPAWKYWGWL